MKAGENMGIMTTLKKPTAESFPPHQPGMAPQVYGQVHPVLLP